MSHINKNWSKSTMACCKTLSVWDMFYPPASCSLNVFRCASKLCPFFMIPMVGVSSLRLRRADLHFDHLNRDQKQPLQEARDSQLHLAQFACGTRHTTWPVQEWFMFQIFMISTSAFKHAQGSIQFSYCIITSRVYFAPPMRFTTPRSTDVFLLLFALTR